MYGRVREEHRKYLEKHIPNLDKVKILAHVKPSDHYHKESYILEANWDSCTHPLSYGTDAILYIDPSINKKKETLHGGYWVNVEAIEIINFNTNRGASALLSKEY